MTFLMLCKNAADLEVGRLKTWLKTFSFSIKVVKKQNVTGMLCNFASIFN